MSNKSSGARVPEIDVAQLVAENDLGGRNPGAVLARLLVFLAITWSVFQLWIASPLPYSTGWFVFNDTESRSIHLGFALLLAYLSYPAFKRSPRHRIPSTDWLLALGAAFCGLYLFIFYRDLATRPGQPILIDMVVGMTGIALLLEATRRVLGLPMVIVALVF
ncbi:MAG: C4-dicarboxylate ABC transporter, partial [Burkholderiaceae bacterium]|nr:C4-dicarboxylate ABC transporter [Burkholderiaceae bacterium]